MKRVFVLLFCVLNFVCKGQETSRVYEVKNTAKLWSHNLLNNSLASRVLVNVKKGTHVSLIKFNEWQSYVKYGIYKGYISNENIFSKKQEFEFMNKKRKEFELVKEKRKAANVITLDIKQEFEKWLLKGEFEKTIVYKKRVSLVNRKNKLEEIQLLIYNKYKKDFINDSDELFELNRYDADNEVFKLSYNGKDFYLKVPIQNAKYFKENFSRVYFLIKDAKLDEDDEFVISKFTAKLGDLSFNYDESSDFEYNNYISQEIDLKELNVYLNHNSERISRRNINDSFRHNVVLELDIVDTNIPVNTKVNINTYCLIIGNEDYGSRQKGLSVEKNVPYAVNDARIVEKYFNRTLGIPSENITLLINATTSEFYQGVDKLTKLAKVNEGKSNLIFYYAGHGLPDEKSKEQYLIPVDVSGNNIKYGVKVNDVVAMLTKYKAKKVTILLDACFSGGARNQGLLATRGVSIVPKSNIVKGNIVLMSSSSGSESASAFDEKQHGMFTYFFLKKIHDTKGDVTYKELFDYIENEVKLNSVLINDREQTPKLNVSPLVRKEWKNWKFK